MLTHTRGLRLKKIRPPLGDFSLKRFDPRAGDSPFDPHLGASPLDPHSGLRRINPQPTLGGFALRIYFDSLASQESTPRTIDDASYDFIEYVQYICTVYIKGWPKLLKDSKLLFAGHSHR
jgi:hypothetical protein